MEKKIAQRSQTFCIKIDVKTPDGALHCQHLHTQTHSNVTDTFISVVLKQISPLTATVIVSDKEASKKKHAGSKSLCKPVR